MRKFQLVITGQFKFSSECIRLVFVDTSHRANFQEVSSKKPYFFKTFVIIGEGQVFKWHHRVMYCIILSFMQLFLFAIAFTYNVSDKIIPGVFSSRLAGINFRIEEEQYSVWPKTYYLCKTSLLWPIFLWLWSKEN